MKQILTTILIAATMISCGTKPYVIVQIADAQLGFTAADNANKNETPYVNDLTYEAGYLEKAVALVNELKPDAVVFTGDQVNYSDNAEQWDTFASIIAGIDKSVKLFHVPGNHDVAFKDGKVDSTPFTSRYGTDRFAYGDRGVKLVGINSNLIKSDDEGEAAQKEWLEQVLVKDSPEDVAIIFTHHPFFMTAIDEEDGYFQIQKSKRREYFDLFKQLDVDAVYAGHRHNSSEGSYEGIPMKTTTSVAYQIGDSAPSVRIITVTDGRITDRLHTL